MNWQLAIGKTETQEIRGAMLVRDKSKERTAIYERCARLAATRKIAVEKETGVGLVGDLKDQKEQRRYERLAATKPRVIPVVTFLTPLAEHFSDLKDR